MIDKNTVLISGACLFREVRGKRQWFLVKQTKAGEWEIPKVLTRKGESSVRAALRISARVLEEAGRAGGATTINGKTLPQRHIYYLMLTKTTPVESIGFPESAWLDYSNAVKKLSSKREKQMLKSAREVLEKWKKANQKKRQNS